jgi:hypothetical protein
MNSDKKDNWTSISAPTPAHPVSSYFSTGFLQLNTLLCYLPPHIRLTGLNWQKLNSNSFESNHHSSLVLITVLSLMGKNTKAPMMVLSKDLSLDHACISEFHKKLL